MDRVVRDEKGEGRRRGAQPRTALCTVFVKRINTLSSKAYSKLWTHRNRLAGGIQSISKCAREIGPRVSQFLNVHGKFSEVSVLGYLLCSMTRGARCLSPTIRP